MVNINSLVNLIDNLTGYDTVFGFNDDTHIDHEEEIIYINCKNNIDSVFNHIINEHKRTEFLNYEPILMVVLHEIGHYMYYDELTEDNLEEYALINLGLDLIMSENDKYKFTLDELNRPYFNTSMEWDATEWALDYIKEHENELKEWRI